ncbi:DNA topoisomerase [Vararia minispora EC-137]|uniref:DNA topoisomerase n=1 Tax=Vararia minispora EC-137 TaxID=1314806 RepID=A0ACB8QMM7_9AGAM|nr:DNA topoisomerase [Vararia minispora EC-137]
MKILCVAEKPSISKSITQILSGGQFATRATGSQYVKNYDFAYPQARAQVTFTCVAGHLLSSDFDENHRKWNSCDPFALFDAPVITDVDKDKKAIATNLQNEARRAQQLMIWTDCDREGENIGAEIVKVCRKTNPAIPVKRARFSAIIAQQIHNAAQHPVELDRRQADAVDARIILDLRIGAAFTRMQTKALQNAFVGKVEGVVSYGPCQFPALGFVVSRFEQVKAFVPEQFWYIYLAITRQTSDGEEETSFTWRRGHLFEFDVAHVIYEGVLEAESAKVTKVTKKNTKKFKPYPLTTVELQKAGSRILKITPKKVLEAAEHLYQQGFVSYPRTETDQYDPQFDFMSLVGKQVADPTWGPFATQLQGGQFSAPRKGKNNDNAHPPIHPTAHANNLVGDEKRVYEFIARRFLACCSKDALGFETTVDVECGGEEFYATGLIVLERNYLDVYPYDKWTGKELPDFEEGETFVPSLRELRDGQTSRPNLLTEADLVGLMDKNGIGTDATIAEHIAKIMEREYVLEKMEGTTKYLAPSTLGMGLVDGYNEIDFDRSLSKPQLRRMTERSMVEVCQGNKTKGDVLEETIEQYREMFVLARNNFNRVIEVPVFISSARLGFELMFAPAAPARDMPPPPPPPPSARPAAAVTLDEEEAMWDIVDSMDSPPPPTPQLAARPPPKLPSTSSAITGPIAGPSRLPTLNAALRPEAVPDIVRCFCGRPARQLVVKKEGPNTGRPFLGCGTPKVMPDDESCTFFQWADEPPPTVPAKRPYPAVGRRATCPPSAANAI